jgi:hypothetical protein
MQASRMPELPVLSGPRKRDTPDAPAPRSAVPAFRSGAGASLSACFREGFATATRRPRPGCGGGTRAGHSVDGQSTSSAS